VTPVSATLPAACDNQPLVQVRWITANAVGNDEWVGIDDISVTGTQDTTPPVVGNPTGITTGPGGVVTYTTPTATDNLDPAPTVVCSPPSGSVFPAGTTLIKCTGTDACGNSTANFNNCSVADNGNGTVDLPPVGGGCGGYISPNDVHMIIAGLPSGTTIRIGAAHDRFFNVTRGPSPNPARPGWERESFGSQLLLHLQGDGVLAGFTRAITIPNAACLSETAPRVPRRRSPLIPRCCKSRDKSRAIRTSTCCASLRAAASACRVRATPR
jgi:hypothetical protein